MIFCPGSSSLCCQLANQLALSSKCCVTKTLCVTSATCKIFREIVFLLVQRNLNVFLQKYEPKRKSKFSFYVFGNVNKESKLMSIYGPNLDDIKHLYYSSKVDDFLTFSNNFRLLSRSKMLS